MIQDILNTPEKLVVNGKDYFIEYNHNSIGIIEISTNKSIYNIYELIMVKNNLPFLDTIELVCGGLLKHHTSREIEEVREYMLKTPSFWQTNNDAILTAFAKMMMPPEVLKILQDLEKPQEVKKKTAKKRKNTTG